MKCLHILWITARSFHDLCSTTHHHLILGLLENRFSVTLINGDVEPPIDHERFVHIGLPTRASPGFQAKTLSKSMAAWLTESTDTMPGTIAVVDWRLIGKLSSILKKRNIAWCLMDRSPPADSGVLASLQWPIWKRAWKLAKKEGRFGCVVSTSHQRFVLKKTGHHDCVVLPAGVNTDLFRPQKQLETFTMVYHGRLDKNRGLLALVLFAQKAKSEGMDVDLVFIGEGDQKNRLQQLATSMDNVHVQETLSKLELSKLLGSCHLGLLPMPSRGVWGLASPLKRTEYISSGLAVYGLRHEGHVLEGAEPEWYALSRQEEFHEQGLAFLRRLVEHPVDRRAIHAFAVEHLHWRKSVDALVDVLKKISQEAS